MLEKEILAKGLNISPSGLSFMGLSPLPSFFTWPLSTHNSVRGNRVFDPRVHINLETHHKSFRGCHELHSLESIRVHMGVFWLSQLESIGPSHERSSLPLADVVIVGIHLSYPFNGLHT